MWKDFGSKPWSYPQPVWILAAYDEDGTPCAMNAAWGGISEVNQVAICLSPGHKTVKNILKTGAFTVSMATEQYAVECDYLGIASGNSVPDKLAHCGLHTEKAAHVNAPLILELPMALECKLLSYDRTSCIMLGEIVNVCADESVLTDGSIDPAKLKPIALEPVNGIYTGLGAPVARAFHDGKKLME